MLLCCSTEHCFTITAARICRLNCCRVSAAKLLFVMLVVALMATQAECGFSWAGFMSKSEEAFRECKYCFFYPPLQRHMSQTLTHAL